MQFKNRDVISIRDFSKQELLHVLDVAAEVEKKGYNNFSETLKGMVIASLFFEPSTRTRLSFEASAKYLGAGVIGFSEPSMTSIAKGETFSDTIKVIDGYCDGIVMRHPEMGSASKAAEIAEKPVINGGDGAHEHPTQTLFDLYTIRKECGHLDGLNVGFLGDLKNGRTVNSLSFALSHFNPNFYFIAPGPLRMNEKYIKELKGKGIACNEEEDLLKVSAKLDILYVTRIQKERFIDPNEYSQFKGFYKLDPSFLSHGKPELKIMHPLPRVDEINPQLDKARQSIYFKQAHNALPVRMALLGLVLGGFN